MNPGAFHQQPYTAQPPLAAPAAGSGGRLLVWYQTLLLSGALAAIYLNLPIYLYVLNSALLPKYIFFGVFAMIAPLGHLE